MTDNIEWIDLSTYGYKISLATFSQDRKARAIVIDGDTVPTREQQQALRKNGFQPLYDNEYIWGRKGNSFKFGEIRDIFPHPIIQNAKKEDIFLLVKGPNPFKVEEKYPEVTDLSEKIEKKNDTQSEIKTIPVSLPVADDTLFFPERIYDFDKINEFQYKYRPRSKVGEAVATIPVNMAEPTEKALINLESKYGNIDDWISKELNWSKEEMGNYLCPEQVDAVALAIEAANNGKGFILADQTGLGKGRVMATMLRWSVINRGSAIFVTEKANLFTDIWRDIKDINSEDIFGYPFLLNNYSNIMDQKTGKVLFNSPKPKEKTSIINSRSLPEDSRLMLATYSQFNRKGSEKAKFIQDVCKNKQLFLDECHNIVGDSNTRDNLESILTTASGVTFSSATFARNAKNMSVYRSVFPDSIATLDLSDVLNTGGPAILEAMSQGLAEAGLLLRREHDNSDKTIQVVVDAEREETHKELSNKIAPIFSALSRLSMRVGHIANNLEETKKSEAERYYSVNFGNSLGSLGEQFDAALLIDLCVDLSVSYMKKGVKPVIVIENTMETLMRELIEDVSTDDDDLFGSSSGSNKINETDFPSFSPPPMFSEALNITLDRIMQISHKRRGKDPVKIPVDEPKLVLEAKRIREMIRDIPEISLSLIDDITQKIEEKSLELHKRGEIERPWVMGEISARNLRFRNGKYEKVELQDRNSIIGAFNYGGLDGLIATRAASTGLSLHLCPRILIELQIPKSVVTRLQFWGRVDRRGQKTKPEFQCLSTSLRHQIRTLANENAKLTELSANVTGNTYNQLSMDVPDIINDIGDEVCKKLLEDTPVLGHIMGITKPSSDERFEQKFHYVNQVLRKLRLLNAETSEKVYQRVITNYEATLAELAAKGRSPKQARVMDGNWTVVSRHIFDPGMPEDGDVFGRPVFLTQIASKRVANPLKTPDIRKLISKAHERQSTKYSCIFPGNIAKDYERALHDNKSDLMKTVLPREFPNVLAALKSSKDNPVKRLGDRIDRIEFFLKKCGSGATITLSDDDDVLTSALILDVSLPSLEQSHVPSAYGIKYILPGDESPRDSSLAALLKDINFSWVGAPPKNVDGATYKIFDEAPSGVVEDIRMVLDGNLFSAVRLSKLSGIGTTATYYDQDNKEQRGVVLPKNYHDRLHQIRGVTRSANTAAYLLLECGHGLSTDIHNDDRNIVLSTNDKGEVLAEVSAKKRAFKNLITTDISKITGTFKGHDWDNNKKAVLSKKDAMKLFPVLLGKGHSFYYSGSARNDAIKSVFGDELSYPEKKGLDEPERKLSGSSYFSTLLNSTR